MWSNSLDMLAYKTITFWGQRAGHVAPHVYMYMIKSSVKTAHGIKNVNIRCTLFV
jgi:hypothetical protein